MLALPQTFAAEVTDAELAVGYNPQINPADFTTDINNPYTALPIGKKMVYEQMTEDGKERLEILIPGWTYEIMGVETLAYWNRLYLGDQLVEDTRDYLAQNKSTGDVWYFGEHVNNYKDGKLHDHEGTWFAGKGTALPGIWMTANPKAGDKFIHEYKAPDTYDTVKILGLAEQASVPADTYANCAKTVASSYPAGTTANYFFCREVADIALEVDLAGPESPVDSRIELIASDPNAAKGIALPDDYAKESLKPATPP